MSHMLQLSSKTTHLMDLAGQQRVRVLFHQNRPRNRQQVPGGWRNGGQRVGVLPLHSGRVRDVEVVQAGRVALWWLAGVALPLYPRLPHKEPAAFGSHRWLVLLQDLVHCCFICKSLLISQRFRGYWSRCSGSYKRRSREIMVYWFDIITTDILQKVASSSRSLQGPKQWMLPIRPTVSIILKITAAKRAGKK